MRFEISFEAAGDLILVEAVVVGPRGPRGLRLVLDTGCALTTLLPEVAEELGYSVDDRIRLSVVQSAVGPPQKNDRPVLRPRGSGRAMV